MGAKAKPLELAVPHRLVYAPHAYGPLFHGRQAYFKEEGYALSTLAGLWEKHFGYLTAMGTPEPGGTDKTVESDGAARF